MTGPGVLVGERRGPFSGCLDADLIRRYAAATKDPSPRVQAGEAVPPVAIVTQIWDAQTAGRVAAISRDVQETSTSGVHGEHDVVLHRPIVPGEPLTTWVEGFGSRPAGRNALVTLRYTTFDSHDDLVAEQWWTTVYLNTTCEPAGPALPDHSFPEEARQHEAGVFTMTVDDDMARRYAEVSNDWAPHHFDLAAAKQSGFDRLFLHGLCTMALCAQGIVATIAEDRPERIRRLAVRFASPTFLGEDLNVRLYAAGPLSYAFEADSAGARVISHGRAELRE
jgi:acyl dehydratase